MSARPKSRMVVAGGFVAGGTLEEHRVGEVSFPGARARQLGEEMVGAVGEVGGRLHARTAKKGKRRRACEERRRCCGATCAAWCPS